MDTKLSELYYLDFYIKTRVSTFLPTYLSKHDFFLQITYNLLGTYLINR